MCIKHTAVAIKWAGMVDFFFILPSILKTSEERGKKVHVKNVYWRGKMFKSFPAMESACLDCIDFAVDIKP